MDNKCIFIEQPCFNPDNNCLQIMEGDIKWLIAQYKLNDEKAKEVTTHNWKLLAPYCAWRRGS